jgi:hypothetical protein
MGMARRKFAILLIGVGFVVSVIMLSEMLRKLTQGQ